MERGFISIRFKLVLFVIFIITLSSAIVTYVNITITKTMAIKSAENTLEVSFSKVRSEIENWLSYVAREIDVYGRRETILNLFSHLTQENKEALINNLKILLSANPEFSIFFIADASGNIVISSQPLPFSKFSPLTCEILSFTRSVRTIMIDGHKRKAVYTCLRNKDGFLIGYFVGVLNFRPLYEKIYSAVQELFQNMSWGITICNREGTVAFNYGISEGCNIEELSTGRGFVEGKKYIKGFYYENHLDSFIVITLAKKDIYGFYYKEISRLLFVVIIFILLASLLTNYLLIHMMRPIDDLVWGARRVGEGNLNIRLPVRTSDELGVLTIMFNQMIERLRQDKEELESAHNQLQEAFKKLESMNKTLTERNKELEIVNAKLQILSITDSLTNLFNHRYLQETLEKELRMAKRINSPISYMMIDIDNFKIFNDTYGHQAGDALLSQLGKIIVSQIRSTDIATRYGGEEFGIILPSTDKDGSIYIAEKLRMYVAHYPFKIMEKDREIEVHITVSIGVSTKRPLVIGPHSREEIIREADEALYHAKKTGKNRVVHYFNIMFQKNEDKDGEE